MSIWDIVDLAPGQGMGLGSECNRPGQQPGTRKVEVQVITTKAAVPGESTPAICKEGKVVHIRDGEVAAVAPQPDMEVLHARGLFEVVAGGDERTGDDGLERWIFDGTDTADQGAEVVLQPLSVTELNVVRPDVNSDRCEMGGGPKQPEQGAVHIIDRPTRDGVG